MWGQVKYLDLSLRQHPFLCSIPSRRATPVVRERVRKRKVGEASRFAFFRTEQTETVRLPASSRNRAAAGYMSLSLSDTEPRKYATT